MSKVEFRNDINLVGFTREEEKGLNSFIDSLMGNWSESKSLAQSESPYKIETLLERTKDTNICTLTIKNTSGIKWESSKNSSQAKRSFVLALDEITHNQIKKDKTE